MALERHFPQKFDFDKYEYFRIEKKNLKEFNDLKKSIGDSLNSNVAIERHIWERFLILLDNVKFQEEIHYLDVQIESVEKVYDYIMAKSKKGYYYEEERLYDMKSKMYLDDFKGELNDMGNSATDPYIVRPSGGNGLKQLIWTVTYELLYLDKDKSFTKDECIKFGLILLLEYRLTHMLKPIQNKFSKYKMGVIAGCITHKVFDLWESDKDVQMKTDEYFQSCPESLSGNKD